MAGMDEEVVVWGRRGGSGREFSDGKGGVVQLPDGWRFVPSGDAGLTRRLKASGKHWCVVHRRRGRIENLGVCVPAESLERARETLARERESEGYRHRLEQAHRRRDERQVRYADAFYQAVLAFLAFAPRWKELQERLAHAVTDHAVPIGSGTVARTETIPLEVRAEAAVIAWMRHQTTCYDQMSIPRIKGERRAVRRRLAERSREVLQAYRQGRETMPEQCPLWQGLLTWEKKQATKGRQEETMAPTAQGKPGKPMMNGHLSDFFNE